MFSKSSPFCPCHGPFPDLSGRACSFILPSAPKSLAWLPLDSFTGAELYGEDRRKKCNEKSAANFEKMEKRRWRQICKLMRYKYSEAKVHAVHKLNSASRGGRNTLGWWGEIQLGNEEQILAISEGGEPRLLCCFCGWVYCKTQPALINRIKRWWQTNKWGEGRQIPPQIRSKDQPTSQNVPDQQNITFINYPDQNQDIWSKPPAGQWASEHLMDRHTAAAKNCQRAPKSQTEYCEKRNGWVGGWANSRK